MFCDHWNTQNSGSDINWINRSDGGPHEANYLKLDCTKIKETLGWQPVWNIDRAMEELVGWYKVYALGEDITDITRNQIEDYLGTGNFV